MDIRTLTDLWHIDARLAALGRGVGVMGLRIGEGLSQLDASGGIHALGFPTLESYAREALGRSGRWAADARALARRLRGLPALRTALTSGALTTSMVELVARVATAEDEVAWVARAEQMTVRAMRVHLQKARLVTLEEEDVSAPRSTLSLTVTRLEALAFERARAIVEAVGATRGDGVIEAILAEGLGELLARDADIDLPSSIGGELDPATRAERAELAILREQAEAAAESSVPPEEVEPPELEAVAELAEGADLTTLDTALRAASAELAARDLELARLARQASEHELWRLLRFASFDHYCRERIGLSPSSVATRIALARRIEALPAVADALVAGRIGYEAATLIARVAGQATVHAWIERAAERTVKHLREEIDAVELAARVNGQDTRSAGPPDEETLEAAHEVERAALQIVTGARANAEGQMSGGAAEAIALPTTALRLSLSDDVARFWRGVEGLHRFAVSPSAAAAEFAGGGESFVAFLVRAVTKTWADTANSTLEYANIYERDRWRCASPVCGSRNVTPHHVIFRSHGGTDECGNVVSLCATCHLELVHENRLRVTGDAASGLAWRAGGWEAKGRNVGPLA